MINLIYNKIISISPYFEVILRKIYWRSSLLIKYKKKLQNEKRKKSKFKNEVSFSEVINKMKEKGITKGDLIIVHSSMVGLKPYGVKPEEVINSLLDLIGSEGTLAMPTYPYFRENPIGKDYINKDLSNLVLDYYPDKTLAWTGMIPNIFLTYPKVIRSRHPLNTLAALGPLSEGMMQNNISGYNPLPNGNNSSWKFCADHNAKIISLGIDLTHSLTMVHTAEDTESEKWNRYDWYRERKFRIIDNSKSTRIVVRERRHSTTVNFAERKLARDLLNEGILTKDNIGGVKLEMILESKRLIEFLKSKNKNGYPYFMLKKRKSYKND
ncbi:AAC(3) family N-acetyltransferase [bacterium]|nr:AAC(3) family N-acetyltransferase [bacterium]MBU4509899.1 AAC(3) family N-acetyltransferase [bacterium]